MTHDRELLEGVFEELKEEVPEKKEQKRKIVLCVFGVLCIGLYLFFLLFGNNSWSALIQIKKQKAELEEQTQRLQRENVDLQKFIFELKGLEPTHEDF